MPSHAGHERMRDARRATTTASRRRRISRVDPVKIDRKLTFDKATERALLRHASPRRPAVAPDRPRHRHLPHEVPRRVRQSVHAVLSGQRLRDGGRRRRAGRSCTSTRRTACTARRATSWTRTRSSTGCRPKAAKARSTTACDALARASASRRRRSRRSATPLIEALGGTYTWRETRRRASATRVARDGRQPILAFWHGRILAATLYFRDRGIVAMTSENFDGEWVARLMRRFGYSAARGSTSRGGARALAQLRREMADGRPAAFTVDGPRGPARVAQPGAVWLASATGNPIVPFHIEASRFWTVEELGSPSGAEAGQRRRDRDRRADRRAPARPTKPTIEAGRARARTRRSRELESAGARAMRWRESLA